MDIDEVLHAAKELIFEARRTDELESLSRLRVRKMLETQFKLEEGTLNDDEYRKAIKEAILEATDEPLPPKKSTFAPPSKLKKRKAAEDNSEGEAAVKPREKSKLPDSDDENEDKPSKPRKRSTVKKPKISDSDDDEGTSKPKSKRKARSKSQSAPKKVFKSSEIVQSSDVEPEVDDDDKMEGSSKQAAVAKKVSKAKTESVPQSDSELSVLEDEPPKTSKRSKKSAEKNGKTKSAGGDSDKHDATIKKLKGLVTACGVRKIWSKVFEGMDKPTEQIRKLKEILAELGMNGQPSMQKAKAIREKRELAQELNDVQTFAAARGMKSQASKAASVEEKDEEEESDDEIVPKKRKLNARQSIMAFLQDQSSDDD
ncbi:hypothetical protein C8F01DRAFT_536557 [Mycena amicta]|nr:hypothetical protein C8F01DRAFT_536557 [Mycena amicta]